jgi:type I restriction enzyme S subunit
MSNKAEAMKKSKRTLVPKLRFPEFRDAGEWEEGKCSDVACVCQGYGFPVRYQGQQTGKYPFYKVSDITAATEHGGQLIDKAQNYINETVLNELKAKPVPVGTIVFAKIGEAIRKNRRALTIRSAVIDNNVAGVKAISGKVTNNFLFYLWTTVSLMDYAGGVVPAVSKTSIKNIPVSYPKEAEQQKIADCLTSLDDLITAQAEKIDTLKAHKKGLLQQLFPREGETTPRLRFPEFRDKGEWEDKELGDVSDVLMCKRIFASETNPKGGVPFYKIGTLGGVPDAYISKNLFEEYKSKYNFPRIGEVLITCSGTIGKCLPYDGSEAYFQDSNIVWLDNPTLEVSNEFLLSILSSVNWSTLNSTTIARIYGPDLRRLPIKFPQNETEQHRIADCLTSLDDLITAQAEKIETLKAHKKGLMQRLFPAPEVRL